MACMATVRVRVPSKRSLEFLMSRWNQIRNPVLEGEYTVPDQKNFQTIDLNRVSHVISKIRTETYNPSTETVAVDVVFTGPMGSKAQDDFVRGDIRFMPRCLRVRPPGGKDSDVFESIVTWDLAHRPEDPDGTLSAAVHKEMEKMRAEANLKDKRTELAKKKIKK